ncbi:MAG TPA: hypothetical protein ENK18_25610 [Deltaproteobacteria bacterium]|nr:hypothetical protein [Deltaproteobacteria bacterium]
MSRTLPRPRWWSIVALVVACTGATEEVDPQADAPAGVNTEAPANPETPEVGTVEQMSKGAESVALVPSPIETQKALEASGIDTQLASLIPEHAFDLEAADTDHAAVRSGVVLADLLLTVKSAKKAEMIQRIDTIARGMEQLEGGDDIQSTLKEMRARIEADAVTRDELLQEFDELSGAVIPELRFNGQDRVVPLIQAGSWLEGANLVSRALEDVPDDRRGGGERLLKAPSVVDHFTTYVQTEGSDAAPEVVTKKLRETLGVLKALAEKTEPLTTEDLTAVTKATGDVLALL